MRAAAKTVIVSRCVRGIDARGLHKTNLAALRQALIGLAPPDAICLVDGFRVPDFGVEQRAVVGGDSQSAAIAGASVLAKVARDRFMRRAAERHPGWDFETNVGYSTPEHRAAIRENGISPLHRLSFASIAYTQLDLEGVFDMVEGDELPPGVEDDAYGVEADAAREALHGRRRGGGTTRAPSAVAGAALPGRPRRARCAGPPRPPAVRVFTSQKTRHVPVELTTSSSP